MDEQYNTFLLHDKQLLPINTMKPVYLTALLLACCIRLIAGETNKLFVTVDLWDRRIPNGTGDTNECLPADQFPEGNWGVATNGIQLSLRVDKTDYTNGETVLATILIRNVSNTIAPYHSTMVADRDGPVRFNVLSKDNHRVEPVQWGAVEGLSADVPPGCQRRFVERFDKDYRLTNGTFFVQAYVYVGPGRVYAESAEVPIKIVSSR